VGLRDEISRYRLRSRRLLPKFGSGEARFRDPGQTPPLSGIADSDLARVTQSVSASGPKASLAEPRPQLRDVTAVVAVPQSAGASKVDWFSRIRSTLLVHTKSMGSAGASTIQKIARLTSIASKGRNSTAASPFSPVPKAVERPLEVASVGGALGRVAAWRPWGRRPVRGANANGAIAPVQCEFSLETVRVVRNDLSDADVEVVAARSPSPNPEAPKPATEPVVPEAGPTKPAVTAWGRVAEQMFGAGKS
jgi:hypothetical protein